MSYLDIWRPIAVWTRHSSVFIDVNVCYQYSNALCHRTRAMPAETGTDSPAWRQPLAELLRQLRKAACWSAEHNVLAIALYTLGFIDILFESNNFSKSRWNCLKRSSHFVKMVRSQLSLRSWFSVGARCTFLIAGHKSHAFNVWRQWG